MVDSGFSRRAFIGGIAGASSSLLLGLTGCTGQPGSTGSGAGGGAAWMPDRNAALIIHADAGGSSDLFGREVAKLLVDSKAVPVAVSPENRPGGSGAVAYTFMKSKTGDPNYLATLSSSYLTAPLSEDLEYSYEDFTNLGFLCADALMIAVRKDSFASLDELITAGKAALGSLKFGGTQTGSADSILLYLLEEKTGVKFTYVSFEGGSEVNAALLGSNVDVIATNPAEVKGLIDGDRVTGLAVSTAERMEGIDVPTMKEAGVDIEFSQARGIMAPGGITDEQKSFWVEALRTVGQSEEFAAWVTDQVMIPIEYYGDEAEQFVASESEKYVEYYKALGLS